MKQRVEKDLDLKFFHFESNGATCGVKASVVIVSDDFKDLSRVERQQKVYDLIGNLMDNIHALKMKTWTVE